MASKSVSPFAIPRQPSRDLVGASSGGYGAANIALRHPGVFGVAIDIAGDLIPDRGAFGGSAPLLAQNAPLVLAMHPRPVGASTFFVGWANDGYARTNEELVARLRASGYKVFTGSVSLGHGWPAFVPLTWKGLVEIGHLIPGPVAVSDAG